MSTRRSSSETDSNLFFRVSSGLKRIIGRDLIVSDFVAMFELVKNSFDARAKHVRVVVEPDAIWIIDDGKGMSYEDLVGKWLFVAYSAKRDGTEDQGYRDGSAKAQFAGNKGVGRFSCDRLGTSLVLQTRKKSSRTAAIEQLALNWQKFEENQEEEFVAIPVEHEQRPEFDMPSGEKPPSHGTVLRIGGLRDPWGRDKLLRLRSHLEKLINPFESNDDRFKITLSAPDERAEDEKLAAKILVSDPSRAPALLRKQVNGPIANFVFAELADKTTRIEVLFKDEGQTIETTLVDRGKLIYKIREASPYKHLGDSGFTCRLFFLNMAAKSTFTRRIGVPAVQFGSVFLFRNGFRVFPIGEEGDDSFELDRRKQQGYARFLGTRDLIGRIDVHGTEEEFREASSRDQGLVETPAYRELLDAFRERCLKRLEAYVVDVTWKDKLDKMREDASGLGSAPARARVIELVTSVAKASSIELIDYARDIVDVLNERVAEFEGSLDDLKLFAKRIDDPQLQKRIARAEQRFRELREAEERAREAAERELAARAQADLRARAADEARVKAEREAATAHRAFDEEKKRNLFLAAVTSLDTDAITNLHHQITIHATDIEALIEAQLERLGGGAVPDRETLFTFLEQMRFRNHQVMVISRLATRANFRMEADVIEDDLAAYVAQYMTTVPSLYTDRIHINVSSPEKAAQSSFKPIEIAIVLDNLVVNARKARARTLNVSFNFSVKDVMQVAFVDDGKGLDPDIRDTTRLFEKGFSTTDGSGLGLYHSRQVMESFGGTIEYRKPPSGTGAAFILTFPV
jgi:signal transduction histidine kinase